MSRISRKNITSKFLHIIVQGIEKRYIFYKDNYKIKYISLIQENAKKFNISIIAFCVMSNHIHICLYYEEIQNVSKFMHMINSLFASYYNYLENRVGYVFRNRYYSKEIRDKNQLFNTIAYIHKNPLKARLVDNISDWGYSTYNDYINCKIDKKIIMVVFGTEKYMDIFKKIHMKKELIDVFDVEENKKSSSEIIDEYLSETNMSMEIIHKDKNLLLELVRKMKYDGKILNKDIAKELNINKNTVTRMLKKHREI